MRVLIVYSTSEGQTRAIAEAMATTLAERGHDAEIVDVEAGDAAARLAAAEAVVVAASVHYERYRPAIVAFAADQREAIAARPNLFVSVSLAAAATDDRSQVAAYAKTFSAESGWRPDEVVHVVGAFRFSTYPFWKRLMMRWLARRKGFEIPPKGDTELTDWDALRDATQAFAARAAEKRDAATS